MQRRQNVCNGAKCCASGENDAPRRERMARAARVWRWRRAQTSAEWHAWSRSRNSTSRYPLLALSWKAERFTLRMTMVLLLEWFGGRIRGIRGYGRHPFEGSRNDCSAYTHASDRLRDAEATHTQRHPTSARPTTVTSALPSGRCLPGGHTRVCLAIRRPLRACPPLPRLPESAALHATVATSRTRRQLWM